jgi:7-cyano-7-deazaguanine synthase
VKTGLLLSGGMDSLALAWWKRPDIAFTVDYGQKAAEAEREASAAICGRLQIEHHAIQVDCRSLGSGDMVHGTPDAAAPNTDWWPYRNQLLITLVATKAIALGVKTLWIGTVKSDGSHKDGTTEFVQRIDSLLEYQEGGLRVEAPAIAVSTAELIKLSGIPSDALAWAHSCHKANVPCGNCRGCNKYLETYLEVGHDLDRAGQS